LDESLNFKTTDIAGKAFTPKNTGFVGRFFSSQR